MGSKDNPHRETLRAALGIIQTAKTLDQARTQLTRMLDDLEEARGPGRPGRCGRCQGRGAAGDRPGAEDLGGRRAAGPPAKARVGTGTGADGLGVIAQPGRKARPTFSSASWRQARGMHDDAGDSTRTRLGNERGLPWTRSGR